MAWDPALVQNLQEALLPHLDAIPGVSGDVAVQCSTNVAALGTGNIIVYVPPDSTATGN